MKPYDYHRFEGYDRDASRRFFRRVVSMLGVLWVFVSLWCLA